MEIIGLQKMLKLVSPGLETQVDTILPCSQIVEMVRTGQKGNGSVLQSA
jgi:hypothetical protein